MNQNKTSFTPSSQTSTHYLSIVSPVYMAEAILPDLIVQIISVVRPLNKNLEILLVEDGSPDRSWEEIEKLHLRFPEIRGIRLSRNFGQHHAISAGLSLARGEWIVVMDCDLQDLPAEIPRLIQKASEGYDVVLAKKSSSPRSFLQKAFITHFLPSFKLAYRYKT